MIPSKPQNSTNVIRHLVPGMRSPPAIQIDDAHLEVTITATITMAITANRN